MKKVFYCTCIYLFFPINWIFAQGTDSRGFIYSKEITEFNFPQFDVCLSLPADAGFKVPFLTGKKVLLEMDNQAYYYVDFDYINDIELFEIKFSLSQTEEDNSLSMYVLPADELRMNQEIDYLRGIYQADNYKTLPSLQTELGVFTAFRVSLPNRNVYDSYILSRDNYSYLFRFNGDITAEKKSEYRELISQLKEKNLAYRRIRYESKVNEDNFAFNKGGDVKELRLAGNQGVLLAPFTFRWVNPGISMQIPAGFKYQIGGEMTYQASDRVDVLTEKSANIGSNLSRFYNEHISINVTDHLSYASAENSVDLRLQSARYADTINIVVDGMPMDAIFYGGKESGVLLFCVETEDDIREISFSGVTNATLPAIERIISLIRLDIPKQGLYTRRNERISSSLKLEGPDPIVLDEPLVLKKMPVKVQSECRLVDLGIRLQLLDDADNYNYEMDKNNLGDTRQIKNKIIQGTPHNSLRIWNANPEHASYTILKEEMKLPLKDDLAERKREWSNYKNTEVVHASLTRINGIDWSLFLFKAGEKSYSGIMTAYKGDYKIVINVPYETEKEKVQDKAAFIRNVWFRVLPAFK